MQKTGLERRETDGEILGPARCGNVQKNIGDRGMAKRIGSGLAVDCEGGILAIGRGS